MRTLPIVATIAGLTVGAPATAQDAPQPVTRTRCGHIVIVSPISTGWEWQVARTSSRAIVVNPVGPSQPGWVDGFTRTERRANRNANLVADVLGGCR